MITHKHRFHGHSSHRFVYRNGRLTRSRLITIRSVHNPQRVHSRLAIVVAKKVVKAAPKRNRIRRRLYEAMRTHWEEIQSGHDIIITVQSPEFLVLSHEQLTKELLDILRDAYLLKQ